MRTLSILQWTAIGRGVPLGGCLQKSGLPPLKKRERKRKREKERQRDTERERKGERERKREKERRRKRERKRERELCNFLCRALLPACYII